jgi:hypothetical protein
VAWRLPVEAGKEAPVRHTLLRGAFVCLLVAPIAAGCVVSPEAGSSAPPEAGVVEADARALAYGRSAGEILENPQIRDKVRAMFGADWEAPAPGVGKLSAPAAQYFELGGPCAWCASVTPTTSRSPAVRGRPARAGAGSC